VSGSTRATFEELAARGESLAAAERAAEQSRAVLRRASSAGSPESNFHHAEFHDLRRLVAAKEKQGITVSLVCTDIERGDDGRPHRPSARMMLMEAVPLVDELIR